MTTATAQRTILDRQMPVYDAVRIEHRVVPGDLETVYEIVREADFIRAWRESPAVRVLFGAREVGERLVSALAGRAPTPPAEMESMRLAEMPDHGDWVLLGEDPPHEIAFGAIGRFWSGETVWEHIDAADFEHFARPGMARIAANFSLREYGAGRVLVSYECRTHATDADARAGFMRYWRVLSPFIGVVLRAMLSVVERDARSRADRPG
jgi:hypothetical protein